MIQIPPEIRIPICIERGSVFNFYIDFNDSKRQAKNRYFIVVNRNPKDDVILIMLTPTTKISKTEAFAKRNDIDPKTIVKISSGEHRIFTKDSVFNCNEAFDVKMSDLIRKIDENGSMNYPKISKKIIKQLVEGIKESKSVLPGIKAFL